MDRQLRQLLRAMKVGQRVGPETMIAALCRSNMTDLNDIAFDVDQNLVPAMIGQCPFLKIDGLSLRQWALQLNNAALGCDFDLISSTLWNHGANGLDTAFLTELETPTRLIYYLKDGLPKVCAVSKIRDYGVRHYIATRRAARELSFKADIYKEIQLPDRPLMDVHDCHSYIQSIKGALKPIVEEYDVIGNEDSRCLWVPKDHQEPLEISCHYGSYVAIHATAEQPIIVDELYHLSRVNFHSNYARLPPLDDDVIVRTPAETFAIDRRYDEMYVDLPSFMNTKQHLNKQRRYRRNSDNADHRLRYGRGTRPCRCQYCQAHLKEESIGHLYDELKREPSIVSKRNLASHLDYLHEIFSLMGALQGLKQDKKIKLSSNEYGRLNNMVIASADALHNRISDISEVAIAEIKRPVFSPKISTKTLLRWIDSETAKSDKGSRRQRLASLLVYLEELFRLNGAIYELEYDLEGPRLADNLTVSLTMKSIHKAISQITGMPIRYHLV